MTVRYYGLYANAHQGNVRKARLAAAPLRIVEEELRHVKFPYSSVSQFVKARQIAIRRGTPSAGIIVTDNTGDYLGDLITGTTAMFGVEAEKHGPVGRYVAAAAAFKVVDSLIRGMTPGQAAVRANRYLGEQWSQSSFVVYY